MTVAPWTLCVLAAALAADADRRLFADAAGRTLPYRLARPDAPAAGAKYPLVLFLHGAGERGDDNAKQLRHAGPLLDPAARREYPCFLAAPQCPADRKWTDTNWQADAPKQTPEPSEMATLVLGLVGELLKDPAVDRKRVYVTGVSMGGSLAWDLATRRPGLFAAAVPVCGGCDAAGGPRLAGLPVWAFQGADDPVVRAAMPRAMVAAVKNAGGDMKYTEYPGRGHDIWRDAYRTPGLLPWLFAQRRE